MKKDKTTIALQNPDAYRVGVEDGYYDAIDKACEWFVKHYREYVLGGDDMISDFRKAMEE